MVENESDNESVESGSCTCSDYNSDSSWFYDSRILGTSYMRFCILSDKDKIIIKKERSNNMFNEKSLNKINKINELEKDLNINTNDINKRKNAIKVSNSFSNRKNEISEDKSKSNDKNIINHSLTRIKDKNSLDFIDNNFNRKDSNFSSNFSRNTHSDLDEINSKRTNFFPEYLNKYEHNYSAPVELVDYHDKTRNLHKSPILYPNKRKNIFNLNDKNNNLEKTKVYESPRRNLYKPIININPNTYDNENNEEKNKNENKIINKNFISKGRIIKEKVVKETKTITLEPGQTIKPKIITKRKLKPNTTIVKNEDGSQNIIIEHTVLTTVTINEIIDSSKLYQDKYPLDVQLVKQYITKTYKSEIENNPYRPNKKEF